MILFKCGNCGYEKSVSEKYAGKRARCPKCKNEVQVPSAGSEVGASGGAVIKFRCPSCNKKIGVGPEYAGRQVRCAACRKPLIVPGGSGLAEGVGPRDDISVLGAGGERPDAGEKEWGGMEGLKELQEEEESAPAVEQPFKLKPVEQESVEGSSIAEDLAAKGVYIRPTPKEKKIKTGVSNNMRAIIIVAVVCGAVLFVVIGGVSWLRNVVSTVKKMNIETGHVQEFVEECIFLLAKGNTTDAQERFSEELHNSIGAGEVEAFAAKVSKATTMGLKPALSKANEIPGGIEYVMTCMIGRDGETYGEEDGVQIFAEVLEIDDVLMIDDLVVMDFSGNETSIGRSNHDEMILKLMGGSEGFAGLTGGLPCFVFLVSAVLVLFLIVSMYKVYEDADKPGWAIFIPFYSTWVLAEIGGRPGWMGLLAAGSGFIPYVGWIIGIGLNIYISIGVAVSFDRGVAFGLGLTFLPLIFYPILAFASD